VQQDAVGAAAVAETLEVGLDADELAGSKRNGAPSMTSKPMRTVPVEVRADTDVTAARRR
jgi:hypothetical protein